MNATARGLLEYGFKNGSKLMTWAGPTEVETVMSVLAAAHTGAHVVGLDGDADAAAVNAALGEAGARGLLIGRARAQGKDRASELVAPGPGFEAMGRVPGTEGAACPTLRMHERFSTTGVVDSSELPHLRYVFDASHPRETNGFLGFFQLPVYHTSPCPLPRVAPFVDPQGPLYTAGYADGSGGVRWGQTASQAGALELAQRGAKALGLTAQDVVLVTAPMHASATMLGVCLGALQAGAKLLLPGRSFDAFQVCSAITRQRPTVLVCTPEQLDATHAELEKGPDRLSPRLLRHEKDRIRSYNAASLRSVAVDVSGGSPAGGAGAAGTDGASVVQFDSSKDLGAF